MDDYIKQLPPMLTGNALTEAMSYYPPYDSAIIQASSGERLVALNDLYRIIYPFPMGSEIYSKLYLALARSLGKKGTVEAVHQRYLNRGIHPEYGGVIGGADSFSIIGQSGIGKSTAIGQAISVISDGKLLEVANGTNGIQRIIPFLSVQCPWDASVKGLLISILSAIDVQFGTTLGKEALRARTTTDELIGLVANALLGCVGVLVVDEIQNVLHSRIGSGLIRALTQLINSAGIGIALVGTPECIPAFESDFKLARRTLGLQYGRMQLDADFERFVRTLWDYRYVKEETPLTDGMIEWLYSHCGGITAVLVSILHDAQEMAILEGSERVTIEVLTRAYRARMSLLHAYKVEPPISRRTPSHTAVPQELGDCADAPDTGVLAAAVRNAKKNGTDPVEAILTAVPVEVIPI